MLAKDPAMPMDRYTPMVWETYMNWAYSHAKEFARNPPKADCEDPDKRLTEEKDRALALILFSAVILDCRLKQYLVSCYPHGAVEESRLSRLTLDTTLLMVPLAKGCSGKSPSDFQEWEQGKLEELRDWRNRLAHGNVRHLTEVKKVEGLDDLPEKALGFFNAVMRAIAAIHKADGKRTAPSSLQLVLQYDAQKTKRLSKRKVGRVHTDA
jgi:hypothetical protein